MGEEEGNRPSPSGLDLSRRLDSPSSSSNRTEFCIPHKHDLVRTLCGAIPRNRYTDNGMFCITRQENRGDNTTFHGSIIWFRTA